MTMFSKAFWIDAVERAIKTFAQVALLAEGQDIIGADLFHANTLNTITIAASGAILSILTSIASTGINPSISPASAVPATPATDAKEPQ